MNKQILLSVEPRVVDELISGEKKFEFRKRFPDINRSDIENKIIIYCSKPVMKIIGSFITKAYFHSDFETLMKQVSATDKYKKRISKYFSNKDSCHALEISDFKLYKTPLELNYLREEFPGFCPGQSYRYLDPFIEKRILSLNGYI